MVSVKKVEAIRVEFDDGIYCQITPSDECDGMNDYWLYRKGYGVSLFMFSCKAESEEEAIALAEVNAPDYIPDLMNECV